MKEPHRKHGPSVSAHKIILQDPRINRSKAPKEVLHGPGPSSLQTSPPWPEGSPHLFLGWRDVFTGLRTHGPPCFLTNGPQTDFVQLQNNFLSVHLSFFPTNLHLSQSHLQAHYRAVHDLLLQGMIAPLPASERFWGYSGLFTVPKKEGKVQPILDLKALNWFVRVQKFRMKSIQLVMTSHQGDFC